jgi:hypothetical protein
VFQFHPTRRERDPLPAHVVAASARVIIPPRTNEGEPSGRNRKPSVHGGVWSSLFASNEMRGSIDRSVMMTGGFLFSVRDGTGAVRQRYGMRF